MLTAIDENGNRVNIKEAIRTKKYYCPLCGGEVYQRHGDIRQHNYAHKSGREDCDGWNYDMSDWHSDWQNQFPKECQEVVVRNGTEFHRADVLIGNVVMEFQHSPLKPEEFEERNHYYNNLGYIVIWLFDTIEQWNCTIKKDMFGTMEWSHCINALKNYKDASGAFRVFLQAEDGLSDEAIVAVRNVDPSAGIKCFECGKKFSTESFVSYVEAISRKKFGSTEVADIIFAECTSPESLRLIDCPMGNREEFANTNKPCFKCRWFKGYEKKFIPATTSCCGYRYRNVDMTIATINSIERFRDTHQIKELDYYDFDGNRRQVKFSAKEYSWRSIPEIWNSIDCSFMRCLNAVTGYCVQINNSPDEQRQKYGTIKGTGVDKRTLQSYRDFKEIKYADSKQWILVYYRPLQQI